MQTQFSFLLILIINWHIVPYTHGKEYLPVYLLHGVMAGPASMLLIEEEIKRHHPGTIVYNCKHFSDWFSLENVWHQVKIMGAELMSICKKHPEGIHLLGYSQGGLISRAILQANPDHCVKNFISVSSPQAGQFGSEFLHLIFPSLVDKMAYILFYSRIGQHTSVANYWNDPHHQELYQEYSNFLPYVNNEIETVNSTQFRNGLLKLEKLYLVGGPDDGVIRPWQSAHFGYFNADGDVIQLYDRDIYKNDTIGLKTLNEQNKLEIITVPHITHLLWPLNITLIDTVLLPLLT